MEEIMKLKNINKEDLELLSYTDLTNMILKENRKTMNTPTIFHAICDLLGYTEAEYTSKIGDYYTSLTIDKRFILLENAEWDLRDHHSVQLVIDDEDEEIDETDEDEDETAEEPVEVEEIEEIDQMDEDEDADDAVDDIDELTIIEEEDEEN